ncbi:hypothetical protein JQC91_16315 [Jannaschia sp. Os4]|uniref:hypothetical protein n=1 Tax=Jannaschia sp. Os4 TaxID=2807617 RepID=UPI0019392C02|nr:hypothetical protein [Jannaschia sp. Os4]MBM2577873.1 hypothetical protein [Jannaschia sp. Os4]
MRPLMILAALSLAAPAWGQTEEAAEGAPGVEEAATVGWAMGRALVGVDRDGDGLFAPEELGGSARRIPEGFDLDGDGLWSATELSQGYFALYDADDSGYLEPAEMQAMRGLAAAGLYPLDI